jgi:hypothetical protein
MLFGAHASSPDGSAFNAVTEVVSRHERVARFPGEWAVLDWRGRSAEVDA